MRFDNFFPTSFLLLVFIAGLIPLPSATTAQDESGGQEKDGGKRTDFEGLLDLSLKNELDAMIANSDKAQANTWQTFIQQMHLRGRAGQPQQIKKIADAILTKHEERNRDRTVTRLNSFFQEYVSPESNTNGMARLIQKGELDRVFAVLKSQAKIEPEIDLLHGVKRTNANSAADTFWLTCKLAAAYHREGNVEASVSTMNLARKIMEGDKYSGIAFDADSDWLPEAYQNAAYGVRVLEVGPHLEEVGLELVAGMNLGSFQQYRSTYYWTLVHLDRAELAIKWYKADVAKRKPPAKGKPPAEFTRSFFRPSHRCRVLGVDRP